MPRRAKLFTQGAYTDIRNQSKKRAQQRQNSKGACLVGLGRLELPTSRLSGVRSNHLSYRPFFCLSFLILAASGFETRSGHVCLDTLPTQFPSPSWPKSKNPAQKSSLDFFAPGGVRLRNSLRSCMSGYTPYAISFAFLAKIKKSRAKILYSNGLFLRGFKNLKTKFRRISLPLRSGWIFAFCRGGRSFLRKERTWTYVTEVKSKPNKGKTKKTPLRLDN